MDFHAQKAPLIHPDSFMGITSGFSNAEVTGNHCWFLLVELQIDELYMKWYRGGQVLRNTDVEASSS